MLFISITFITLCVYDFGLHTIQLLRFTRLAPVLPVDRQRPDPTMIRSILCPSTLFFC